MKFAVALACLAVSFACLIFSIAEADAANLPVTITNSTGRTIQVRFFSFNRKVWWPGEHSGYDLNNGGVGKFNLGCNPGEKICYGAWSMPDEKSNWGVGIKGTNRGCTTCCWFCGAPGTAAERLVP